MSRVQRIHDILSTELTPSLLDIKDESHQHSVPKNSESHFNILIVSEYFNDLNRISRHRKVNQLIHDEFSKGLHALSLHLYSPKEWAEKASAIQDSPACLGGSLHDTK